MSPAPKLCPEQQQERILLAAADTIAQSSLLDFTMSNIAKRSGMSMGSIYKHMHTKEDVLVALATHSFQCLHQVFSTVLASPLTTPERLIAISMIDFGKIDPYPFSRHLEMLVSSEALLKRASPNWKLKLRNTDAQMGNLFQGLLLAAVDAGELIPEPPVEDFLQQLQLGIWAINVGYVQVILQTHSRSDHTTLIMPTAAPNDPRILNTMRLINSYPWRQSLDPDGISKAVSTLENLGFR